MIGLAWGALAALGSLFALGIHSPTEKRFHVLQRLPWRDIALALAVAGLIWVIQVPALSIISFAAVLVSLHQRRLQRLQRTYLERSESWPDAIDFLISSIRAGMTIGSSLMALQQQGPQVLKPILLPVHQALNNGSSVSEALRLLRIHANDPVADRIALILEISQDVGGSSLGAILRSLSSYVRTETRTRAELISRQAWTINAAKLAVVAPWLIVLILSIRAHEAYATATGSTLLLLGSLATSLGYGWMRRAARLPLPARLS